MPTRKMTFFTAVASCLALLLPFCGGNTGVHDDCVAEICNDGVDNDCDGAADLLDPDCQSPSGEICGDGVDNDGDGAIDCFDGDCGYEGAVEFSCGDGRDNDCDGAADCLDPDCAPTLACSSCATEGRTLCGGECVDTASDPRHCGGCGIACSPGDVCQSSSCRPGGDCRETPCTGFTYCNLADGACMPGCASSGQCGSNESCDVATHQCACNAGFHRCSGMCVSNGSPLSCGSLCEPCPADPNGHATCDGSVCGTVCNENFLFCGGRCTACPTGGTVGCAGDRCVCLPGYHDCGGRCLSNTSVEGCGTSCTPCPTDPNGTPTCDGASCGLDCSGGYHVCGGACASNVDPQHCGTLCTPCPALEHATATCDGTSCGFSCVAGYVLCGGECCEHCSTAGCTGFTWCNAATGLCEEGCTTHDQCAYGYFCYLADHACARTVDSSCPAGYTYMGMCSNGTDFCVHGGLPSGTQYVFEESCPAGTTDRGYFHCSGYTYVCVPD
jgi:hypothetical protein